MEKTYVVPEELRSRFRSKRDLYKQLTIDLGLHLPSYKHCSILFLRQLFAGEKQALSKDDVRLLEVPKYQELSVENLWNFIKECDDLLEYFPDLEEGKIPERGFCLSILSTLRHEELKTLVQDARKHRSLINDSNNDQQIEMTPNIKEALFGILPQKTSAERAHYLLKRGAKLKKAKASPKKYHADLAILKKNDGQDDRDQQFIVAREGMLINSTYPNREEEKEEYYEE